MGIFKRNKKKDEAEGEGLPAPPPPDILGSGNTVICTVREPWRWVISSAFNEADNFTLVDRPMDLPSASKSSQEPVPSTPSSRRRKTKVPKPCTLRLEIQDKDGGIIEAIHGTSEAFDGLEDKDELVRTIQRCRCENLELSPPSRLINWDVTKDECMNVVGNKLPTLSSNKQGQKFAVLKEPMGSRGTGVYFVKNAEEIHEIVEDHRKRAVNEPELLDNLIATKGRIPSWVLQAEVAPALLIRDRRKFHIRSYVVCLEMLDSEGLVDIFLYNRHEIRIASEPVPEGENEDRSRSAHITNGAYSNETDRVLLDDEPELKQQNLSEKLERFVAKIFSEHLINDIAGRVSMSAREREDSDRVRKFAIAGLDIMVSQDHKFYLLEVNVNPAAPPKEVINDPFRDHLVGFMKDLTNLIVRKPSPNFVSTFKILEDI